MEQLTAAQLTEWEAYDELEPIGEQRADFRIALLCMVIKNLAISAWASKGTKLATIGEFLDLMRWDKEPEVLIEEKPKKQMSDNLLTRIFKDWAGMVGAKDNRKK